MTVDLPAFEYHPDPVGTGSIIASDLPCRVCGPARGYLYDGLPYAREELERCICPWCIDDGSAAGRFGAVFTDTGGEEWDAVAASVVDIVLRRTPGFWQQERWLAHCDDAMVFLGPMGFEEPSAIGPAALDAVAAELLPSDEPAVDTYLRSLQRDGEPTACLFRCRHCGRYRGYSDFTRAGTLGNDERLPPSPPPA